MTRGIRQAFAPVMIAAGLIAAWEITLRLAHVPGYVLPRPSAIAQKAVSDWPVLATGIAGLVLLQPWLMRMSRVLYLYMFVRYGQRKEGK